MDKPTADKIITSFLDKIYGFSLSKTMNIDKAEELASRITYEVYKALLNSDVIHNIDSYIYRIASNIYSQYVNEDKKNQEVLLRNEEKYIDNHSNRNKEYETIRREISYLSNLQREIVYMHYFQKMKTKEIANQLKVSQAKVKWHLIDARNQIKEGFLEDKQQTNNKVFSEMRSIGKLGYIKKYIDMSFYFNKILSQSIAYSAYHKPKTSTEIAREIATPVAFVEDEINFLVDNGFMNKLTGNRYLTNIYILEQSIEYETKIKEILTKYAVIISEIYVPLIIDFIKKNNPSLQHIYTPQKDNNFLLWSLISFACVTKLITEDKATDFSKYMIKRKDGGLNMAHANVIPKKASQITSCGFTKNHVDLFINSNFPKTYPITSWQFFSPYDDRDGKFTEWVNKLFFLLYDYMNGKISKDISYMDNYAFLCSKGFIASSINETQQDYVNIVVTKLKQDELIGSLPDMPKDLVLIGNKLNNEMYNLTKSYIPEHKINLCKDMNLNSLRKGLLRVYVLDYLLTKGLLKPLMHHQKQTVNMILFADRIP